MEKDKKRVLQILRGSGAFGGVASFLLSRYALMDLNQIKFSFLFCQEDCIKDDLYVNLIGKGNIYELKALTKKNHPREYIELYKKLLAFLKKNHFDCVHINTGSLPITYICLKASKDANVPVKIAHSHSSNYKNGLLNTNILLAPLKKYLQTNIYNISDYHFACSEMAAINMFGNNRQYTQIYNSIDISKYDFNEVKRQEVRGKYTVSNRTVYGYVGRLSESKNIPFIIKVFVELKKQNKESKLWIVGDGEERNKLIQIIKNYGLVKDVVLFGTRTDVNELMQAMDAFIFPSLYEGLSLTIIEAQAAGLPIYMSNTLSQEHKITELVHFLPLNSNSLYWAEYIINHKSIRISQKDIIKKAGYDLMDSVKWLQDFYIQKC